MRVVWSELSAGMQLMAARPDIVQALLPRLFAFPSELLSKTLKEEK